MTALAADRNTPRRAGHDLAPGVAAGEVIYGGAIVALDADGYAVPGGDVTQVRVVGVASDRADNTGGLDAAIRVPIERTVGRFENSASTDAITAADVGAAAWLVDDQTVARTHGGGTRIPAGRIVDVDSIGVWVEVGAAADTAGAGGRVWLQIEVGTLVGAGVYRAVSPVAGRITRISSIIEGVLTTGDATLTAKIHAGGAGAGVAVTGGVVTITQVGSAAGDVDVATPTAANVVAPADGISVTVGGSNATASEARVLVEITL